MEKVSNKKSNYNTFEILKTDDSIKMKERKLQFRRTDEELKKSKKMKCEYKSEMFSFLGLNWKKLSRMLGVHNVPNDVLIKNSFRELARKKHLL